MSKIELQGKVRTAIGKGLYALRNEGKIPAVLYGPGVDSVPIELEAKVAAQKLNGLTGSTLIDLKVDKILSGARSCMRISTPSRLIARSGCAYSSSSRVFPPQSAISAGFWCRL
jgi:ribosomal protein L25 (general stress protein Ctc)